MGIGAAAFADDRNRITGQGVTDIAPANDGPSTTMIAQDLYRAETAGYALANTQQVNVNESPVSEGFNRGVNLVGNALGALLGAAAEPKKPEDQIEEMREEIATDLQRRSAPSMQNFTLG